MGDKFTAADIRAGLSELSAGEEEQSKVLGDKKKALEREELSQFYRYDSNDIKDLGVVELERIKQLMTAEEKVFVESIGETIMRQIVFGLGSARWRDIAAKRATELDNHGEFDNLVNNQFHDENFTGETKNKIMEIIQKYGSKAHL